MFSENAESAAQNSCNCFDWGALGKDTMEAAAEKKPWQYRFDNFKRAYFLLQEAADKNQVAELSQLAKEGMIQRFEYCMELAWKTIKDYLESQNVVFAQITPGAILKEAIGAKLLSNGEDWMEALDARNKMSHTYDFRKFEAVIKGIEAKYLNCFGELYERLSEAYIESSDE